MFVFSLLYKHHKISLSLFLVALALLLYGLFTPQIHRAGSIPNLDKLAHFCGFFSVFLFGRFASHWFLGWSYWLFPAIAAAAFEYLQGELVPSRSFSYLDMAANGVGVLAALLLWWGFLSVQKQGKQSVLTE